MAKSSFGSSDDFFVLAVNDGQMHELFRALPADAPQLVRRLETSLIDLHARNESDCGDRLRLINKRVYINGAPLHEPYVQYITALRNFYRDDFPRTDSPDYGVDAKWWKEMPKLVEDHQLIIPEGHYFVLGDNRDDSQDSRYWGFVPRENIIGRPLLIYWSSGNLNNDLPGSPTVGDRLYHLAYAVTHLLQITRWERTFRLVR